MVGTRSARVHPQMYKIIFDLTTRPTSTYRSRPSEAHVTPCNNTACCKSDLEPRLSPQLEQVVVIRPNKDLTRTCK